MLTTPVTGLLERIEGVNFDSLDHEADVVRLPVQVKVCDVDGGQDGEDGVDNDQDGVDDDPDVRMMMKMVLRVIHTYRSVDAIDGLDMPRHHLK